MKRKNLINLLIILAVLASCIHEFSDNYLQSADVEFSITEAKRAFEKEVEILEIKPLTTSLTTRNNKNAPIVTPQWNNGEVFRDKNGAYATIPFNISLTKVFARSRKDMKLSDEEKYNNTDIRLLIQKKQNNEYLYSIVHITGDFSYIVKNHKSIKTLKLDNLDSFSGYIRYFDLKGQMLWGEIYREGKKVGKISFIESAAEHKVEKALTRGYYETYCEDHLIEYENCYHYGYDIGEGYEESGEDCVYDYEWEEYCYDVWVDEEEEIDLCPYCGNPVCTGDCISGGDSSGDTDPPISESIKAIKDKLDVVAKNQIGERKFSIRESKISGLAYGITKGTLEEVLYKNIPTEITINKGLTEIQLKFVMSHEYVHIILYEKSRTAGNAEKLLEQDKDLYNYINDKKDAQQAHHEYMGKHTDIMENILRDTFKGESEDFYNYGKWAGGGVHSDAFKELDEEKQKEIKMYLRNNKL